MRNYLSLYVVIVEVKGDEISIFNPEINEIEIYKQSFFDSMWDGILILLLPKDIR